MDSSDVNQVTFLAGLKETVSFSLLLAGASLLIVAARHIFNQYGDSILWELKDRCFFFSKKCTPILNDNLENFTVSKYSFALLRQKTGGEEY